MRCNPLVVLVGVPLVAVAASPRALHRTVLVLVDGVRHELAIEGAVLPRADAPEPHVVIRASTPVRGLAPVVARAIRGLSYDGGACGDALEVVDVRPLTDAGGTLEVRAEVRATVRECVELPVDHDGLPHPPREAIALAADSAWVTVTLRPSVRDGAVTLGRTASLAFDDPVVRTTFDRVRLADRVADAAEVALRKTLEGPRPDALRLAVLTELRVGDGEVHGAGLVPVTADRLDALMGLLVE